MGRVQSGEDPYFDMLIGPAKAFGLACHEANRNKPQDLELSPPE